MIDSTKKLPVVDIDMLTMALQAADLETTWWLDISNGEVMPAPESNGDVVEQKLIKEKQNSPDRYIDIEPISNNVHEELMESYIATLEEAAVCELLYEALQRKQPSWHFKNALAKHPECEDNWYAFKEQFYALQARQWLRDRDLEYREDRSFTDSSSEMAIDLGITDSPQACLELVITRTAEKRRYMIWPENNQIMLTVFSVEGDRDEQVLSEIQINEHQLSGVNRILEGYKPVVDLQAPGLAADTYLRFSNQAAEGELKGVYVDDSVFGQLVVMLDMLLGIPAIQT